MATVKPKGWQTHYQKQGNPLAPRITPKKIAPRPTTSWWTAFAAPGSSREGFNAMAAEKEAARQATSRDRSLSKVI